MTHEKRIVSRRELLDEILSIYAGVRLPPAERGLSGQAAADRALLRSSNACSAAKALHRALLTPEHHDSALWYLTDCKPTDFGITSAEWAALQRLADAPAPTRETRTRATVCVSLYLDQIVWLKSRGSNLSEVVRDVIAAAIEGAP